MMNRKLLLAAAAIAAMVALPGVAAAPAAALDFQWDPKAPNLADCLTRHSETYCKASVGTGSIQTLAHVAASPCYPWETLVKDGDAYVCDCVW